MEAVSLQKIGAYDTINYATDDLRLSMDFGLWTIPNRGAYDNDFKEF